MITTIVGLWRRWPFAIYVAVGIVVALVMVAFIPFGPRTSLAGKLFFTVMLSGFATMCIAAMFWAAELVAALVRWLAGREQRTTQPVNHSGALPELSPSKQAQVRRAVKLLTEAGVFDQPFDPALLHPGVAERGEPVKPVVIFEALAEAGYYHPDFSPPFMANLVQHGAQVEQPSACLADQIDDLARLSGGALDISGVVVEQMPRKDSRIVDTRIEMAVNGEAVRLAYARADKGLSTVLHHDLAARLRGLGDGRRFAWIWDDAGPWISCLADGTVEELNAAFKLGERSAYRWTWIDAEPPFAAGEV